MPNEILNVTFPYSVNLKFPGDLEYIPAVRKFISEILQVSDFDHRFAYRSEIIVDEICNNAVSYGCKTNDASVELSCTVHQDRIEFDIKDQGGSLDNIERLRTSLSSPKPIEGQRSQQSLGIEIVRMLSEEINFEIDAHNVTSIHIVRRREDDQE